MACECGPLLRVYRAYWGITQKDMSALLHMSQSAYSRTESGEQSLPFAALEKIADKCGVSVQTLIMARLLLDDSLALINENSRDPAKKILIKLADEFGMDFAATLKVAAALGFLLGGAPDDQRRPHPTKFRGER